MKTSQSKVSFPVSAPSKYYLLVLTRIIILLLPVYIHPFLHPVLISRQSNQKRHSYIKRQQNDVCIHQIPPVQMALALACTLITSDIRIFLSYPRIFINFINCQVTHPMGQAFVRADSGPCLPCVFTWRKDATTTTHNKKMFVELADNVLYPRSLALSDLFFRGIEPPHPPHFPSLSNNLPLRIDRVPIRHKNN